MFPTYPTRVLARSVVAALFALVFCRVSDVDLLAQSATSDTGRALAALDVGSGISLWLDGKDIRYGLNLGSRRPGLKADGALVTAKIPIKVTFQKLNPFKIQATASTSLVDDPTSVPLAKLIEAIAGLPATLGLATSSTDSMKATITTAEKRRALVPGSCKALNDAAAVRAALTATLYSSNVSAKSLGDAFDEWAAAVTAAFAAPGKINGADAVGKGLAAVNGYDKTLTTAIATAKDAVNALEANLAELQKPDPTPQQLSFDQAVDAYVDAYAKSARNAKPPKPPLDKANAKDMATILADPVIAGLKKTADDANDCAADALAAFQMIRLTNPEARLVQYQQLETAIKNLAKSIKDTYGTSTDWEDSDFILLRDVAPTSGKLQHISIKVTSVSAKATDASLTVSQDVSASAAMDLQPYSTFVAELGIGATFGFVTQPKYGTGTDAAGNTIVTKSGSSRVMVQPTVMVNFVPRRVFGPAPIIQIGAAASKDTPAVFAGVGWRVPGNNGGSGIVVGMGLMAVWIKDLTKLHEGSTVTGTSAIDADLSFDPQPKFRYYLNIQYKF